MKFKCPKRWTLVKFILFFLSANILIIIERKPLKLAICTMARNENLYIKEYIDYYLNLGFDHIYIYSMITNQIKKI